MWRVIYGKTASDSDKDSEYLVIQADEAFSVKAVVIGPPLADEHTAYLCARVLNSMWGGGEHIAFVELMEKLK